MTSLPIILSHIDINVSDYPKSIRFYDLVLCAFGWKRLTCRKTHTVFSDGTMKIILSPTEEKYQGQRFHRKATGLNHLAFYAKSKEAVDSFFKEVMLENSISPLYEPGPHGDKDYYAVYFEDPDRIKIEFVFAPGYCHPAHWTNEFQDDFDPWKES